MNWQAMIQQAHQEAIDDEVRQHEELIDTLDRAHQARIVKINERFLAKPATVQEVIAPDIAREIAQEPYPTQGE